MRVHIKKVSAVCVFTLTVIFASFSGLAGSFSVLIAFFLPCFFVSTVVHLIISWTQFSFHQTFSNDHPHKGETVQYHLSMTNEGFLPFCDGYACFAQTGPMNEFPEKVYIPTLPHSNITFTEEIQCSYRGSYTVGVVEIHFKDALGLIEIIETIEPRTFYVYPEIVSLGSQIEQFAESEGSEQIAQLSREKDISIFECVSSVRAGESTERIAWKHWAATGMPVKVISGFSGSAHARIILDLFPGCKDTKENDIQRLASEDMATSIVFSLCARFIELHIPISLCIGSTNDPTLIQNSDDFNLVYKQSTGIVFNDKQIPVYAFNEDNSTILVTCRSLLSTDTTESKDLFSFFIERMQKKSTTHLFLCPPTSLLQQEKKNIDELIRHKEMSLSNAKICVVPANSSKEEVNEIICP